MPLIDRRDIDFQLFDWLKIDSLLERPHFADHSRDVVEALIDLAADLAENEFLPHHKKSDQVEPRLEDGEVKVLPETGAGVRAFIEAGFTGGPLPAKVGGLQLPYAVHSAAMAYFFAANISTAGYSLLSIANSNLLATFGTEAQIEAFARPQLEGQSTGTMCLSEPAAGSSLGDITTRAEPDGENEYGKRFRIFGNKMWISGGDHDVTPNIVHLVLAKEPGPDGKLVPGPKGISLFATPKVLPDGQRNDVSVAGLNHKMGYRGLSNCLLNFGEGARHRPDGAAGAIGYRIGESGQGLALMFMMMNEARINVGISAAALGYRSYLHALQYARERRQGRLQNAKDPTQPPILLIDHPDVRLMLLAQKAYAEGGLALCLYGARLVDEVASATSEEEKREADAILGLLTPIVKTWPSEWGLVANDLAIQVHGGYGYTRDFDVEQLYRENRLNPIHEGTTGIQAIDLLGRKILRDREGAIDLLGRRIEQTVGSAPAQLADDAAAVDAAWRALRTAIEGVAGMNDLGRAMWNATPLLRAFGHAVVAWLWLDQANAALGKDPGAADAFTQGKLAALRYFARYELPKNESWLGVVRDAEGVAALMPEDAFGG